MSALKCPRPLAHYIIALLQLSLVKPCSLKCLSANKVRGDTSSQTVIGCHFSASNECLVKNGNDLNDPCVASGILVRQLLAQLRHLGSWYTIKTVLLLKA